VSFARRIAIGAAAVVTAALVAFVPRVARGDDPIPALPLAVAVADDTQTDAWIDAQITEADRLFGAHGVHFAKVEARRIPAAHAHLETRKDRDALAALLRPDVINVFVVAALRDVDERDRYRMGVCWSPRGEQASRFVVVSAIAKPSVLAHELGHYFGNPHSRVVNNVMSYEREEGMDVFFDPSQARIIRASARSYLSAGLLKPRAPRPAPEREGARAL
jgi:hypothetical protein